MAAEPRVIPRPTLGTPPRPRVPAAERTTLPNGLRIVSALRRGIPHLAVRLVVPAGSTSEPEALPGTAALVAALLAEGTTERSAAALHARLDALGASFEATVGHDWAAASATLLSETVASGLPLFAEVTTLPAFPEAETERVRAEALDALEARDDEPGNVADDVAARELFGRAHPYGRPSWGTAEGVAAATRDNLLAFHRARYRPDGALLIVAGDPGDVPLHALLAEVFGKWEGSAGPPAAPSPPRETPRTVQVPWPGAAQTEIRLCARGLSRNSPDWIPAAVANHILGGSTITSRLGANLRERRGWTYGVRSGFSAGVAAAGWSAETAVGVGVGEAAVQEMRREMLRMTAEPVSPEELRRAQDALVLSLPRAFETPAHVAGRLATQEAYELGSDYWERLPERVEAVTAEDVLRIAGEHLHPDGVTEVLVGTSGG